MNDLHQFENPVDTRNRQIILELVTKYFGLDQNSEKEFTELLYEPNIDEVYKQYLDNDLRARFPVDKEKLEVYDISWSDFKEAFSTYVDEFNVTYADFIRGKITVNKGELRIFKHLVSYYLDGNRAKSALYYDLGIPKYLKNSTNEAQQLQNRINSIIKNKLPSKSSYEVVLSLNFADWFLCSTKEEWTSCLNLESDYHACYWSGLPGYIKDKNRAMIYITDGRKKEYKGIVVDKILSRSFTMLDSRDNINYLRWYPNSNFYESGVFSDIPFELRYIDTFGFNSIKHDVKPLFFNNGFSCFAYQDKTAFEYNSENEPTDSQKLVLVEKGGQFYLNKNNKNDFIEGGVFSFTGGFSGVVSNNLVISDLTGNRCENCGVIVDEEYSYTSNDEGYYCESCYNQLYGYCCSCDQEYSRDEIISCTYGIYCQECYDESFVQCSDCGREIPVDETIGKVDDPENGLYYCYYCSNTRQNRVV